MEVADTIGELTFTLSKEEQLVFFEFLARYVFDKRLALEDAAECEVLTRFLGKLESYLADPFAPDYAETLERARAKLRPSDPDFRLPIM